MEVLNLGLQPYRKIMELQRRLLEEVITGERGSILLLVRHYPVFTVGRAGAKDNFPLSRQLEAEGLEIVDVERGGDITYHGPGQMVAYPLWKLESRDRDLHVMVRKVEGAAMGLLRYYGLDSVRRKGLPGVWVPGAGEKKIAALGMSLKKWVTFHGIAINIREEGQEPFKYINPCGLPGVKVTSLEKETGLKPPWEEIYENFVQAFSEATGLRCIRGNEE